MKRVLVTGASGGLGQAIAKLIALSGFFVVLHYRSNKAKVEALLGEIHTAGGQGSILGMDISQRDECQQKLEKEVEDSGAFWGVVCNAGLCRDAAFPAMTGKDWDDVIHTNLDGFYNVVQPLVMPMVRLRDGGRIVTIASVSGLVGNRGQVNYSASKAGLIGATKALALELAKRKITVNCVAPGVIDSEMVEHLDEDMLKGLIPMQRFGQPEEVAGAVGYLFSDVAAYVTRQVISVNGGMV